MTEQETIRNIESYSLNNWNINFDPNNGNKQINQEKAPCFADIDQHFTQIILYIPGAG